LFYYSTINNNIDNHITKKIFVGCKDICIKYKATKTKNGPRYAAGQKRCHTCDIFLLWEGVRCPCCGFKLRVKPRSPKYRKNYRVENNIQYI